MQILMDGQNSQTEGMPIMQDKAVEKGEEMKVEDVKEFIKLLKEKGVKLDDKDYYTKAHKIITTGKPILIDIVEIDKLVRDKLK